MADADSTLVIVARFLALLELFREAAIAFDQAEALGELTVRWTGQDEGEFEVGDEFDEVDDRDDGRRARRRADDAGDERRGERALTPVRTRSDARRPRARRGASRTAAPTGGRPEAPRASAEEQVAFDINDFPGGARGAIEAVLMVVDEPVTEMALASALELPVEDVVGHLHALAAGLRRGQPWLHRCAASPVAGGSTAAPTTPRWSRSSCSTASRPSSPRPPWRPWRWWPTASRSRASRVSAVRGVNVDGVFRTLLTRGLIAEVGAEDESGATLYGTTAVLPATARARQSGRPAGPRPLPTRG